MELPNHSLPLQVIDQRPKLFAVSSLPLIKNDRLNIVSSIRHSYTNFVFLKYCIWMMNWCSNMPNQEPIKSRDFNCLIRRKYKPLKVSEFYFFSRLSIDSRNFYCKQMLIFSSNQIIEVSAFNRLLIRYIRTQIYHSNAIVYDNKVSVVGPTLQVQLCPSQKIDLKWPRPKFVVSCHFWSTIYNLWMYNTWLKKTKIQ